MFIRVTFICGKCIYSLHLSQWIFRDMKQSLFEYNKCKDLTWSSVHSKFFIDFCFYIQRIMQLKMMKKIIERIKMFLMTKKTILAVASNGLHTDSNWWILWNNCFLTFTKFLRSRQFYLNIFWDSITGNKLRVSLIYWNLQTNIVFSHQNPLFIMYTSMTHLKSISCPNTFCSPGKFSKLFQIMLIYVCLIIHLLSFKICIPLCALLQKQMNCWQWFNWAIIDFYLKAMLQMNV